VIDLSKFQFSIIYSIDVPTRPDRDEGLDCLTPPDYGKRGWVCTERGPSEDYDARMGFRPGRHRKHCAVLSFAQFCDFIEHCGLYVEKCQTMGSIGAPGCGFGLVPAVPFQADHYASFVSCYVTPMPSDDMLSDPNQLLLPGLEIPLLDFEAVEQAMWEWFDGGAYSARETAKESSHEQVFA